MNKLAYKITLIISTFILGLSVVGLWKFQTSTPPIVLSDTPNSGSVQEVKKSENKEIKSMLKMNELKINGVELDSSFSTVVRQIGKPLQVKKGGFDNCANGFSETLQYSGLIIELLSDEKGRNFTVSSIDVKSSKWSVSGISVGANKKDVKTRFGHPDESSEDILYYGNNDGWINFIFQNDKLVEISWKYNLC